MLDALFGNLNLWFLFVASCVVLFLASEAGLRIGRRYQAQLDEATRSHTGTVEAALLGLLALLLGFAFVLADGRYERRRDLIVDEAIAIERAYLRARLLPEPHHQASSRLLREYLDARLEQYEAGEWSTKAHDANVHGGHLLRRLWEEAAASAKVSSDEVRTGYYVESLNQVIDARSRRLAIRDNHVPGMVLLLLYFVAMCALGVVGFGCSHGKGRHILIRAILTLVTVATIQVIIDLDRPQSGYIVIGERHLQSLRRELTTLAPE